VTVRSPKDIVVAIIGVGTMGAGIAQVAATSGDLHGGLVELPAGELLGRSAGATAAALARTAGRPVILIDRTLDDATASAIAVARSADCPADALDTAVGLLQAAGLQVSPLA